VYLFDSITNLGKRFKRWNKHKAKFLEFINTAIRNFIYSANEL